MGISAQEVKALRERTGAGMMECKRALTDAGGDIEAAVDAMRKAGLAKADKKAHRVTAEGLVGMAIHADGTAGAMVEVNCETDFVAKEDGFQEFVAQVTAAALAGDPADVDALHAVPVAPGAAQSIEERRRELVAVIGENITVRRFTRLTSSDGVVGGYLHGGRIGVLVALAGGDAELAKDIAMHVAWSRPVCLTEEEIPPELLEKEKEIFSAQAASSGKPPQIIEKMVTGRLKKYVEEVTLLKQPFVKNPDATVEKHAAASGAKVVGFQRLEVGEGLEKRSENFAEEVMAQVRDRDPDSKPES